MPEKIPFEGTDEYDRAVERDHEIVKTREALNNTLQLAIELAGSSNRFGKFTLKDGEHEFNVQIENIRTPENSQSSIDYQAQVIISDGRGTILHELVISHAKGDSQPMAQYVDRIYDADGDEIENTGGKIKRLMRICSHQPMSSIRCQSSLPFSTFLKQLLKRIKENSPPPRATLLFAALV